VSLRSRKILRLAAALVGALLLLAAVTGGWFYTRVRASLPLLDGTASAPGLGAPVTIARDALGVPAIRGQSRADVSRALGWLHAQERFFQMDLLRRTAAGELAELFGSAAVPRDRAARLHGFRTLARTVLAAVPPAERALLDAYTAGVNAGLAALAEQPFEYLTLRTTPRPWLPEDSVLVIYALTMDLQDPVNRREQTLMVLRDTFGEEAVAFFAATQTPADAALDGSTAPLVPIPGPKLIDLRKRPKPLTALPARPSPDSEYAAAFPFLPRDPAAVLGSNAFALSGAHTATGAALLASDPHLDHSLPNTWYRASLAWPGHQVTGATLPGLHAVVIGSNGRVAWGLTVAYADTGDLIVLETSPISPRLYRAPGHDELLPLEKRIETILVKGAAPVTAESTWSLWGPVITTNDKKRPVVYRWTAHDPAATNLAFLALETATDTPSAVALAHRAGMPALNILIADSAGDIAWTVTGALPRRLGYDGRLPTNWSFGDRRWQGLLPPDDYPVITTKIFRPPGRNPHDVRPTLVRQRPPNRRPRPRHSRRRRLCAPRPRRPSPRCPHPPRTRHPERPPRPPTRRPRPLPRPVAKTPPRHPHARRHRREKIPRRTPRPRRKMDRPRHRRFHQLPPHPRISRRRFPPRLPPNFRTLLRHRPLLQLAAPPARSPCWALLRERPAHLLNPAFPTWDAVLLAAADDVVADLEKSGTSLARATWGDHNTVRLRHPFSYAMPAFLTGWLNFPTAQLPGDHDMPRVQSPRHGASLRMVVSPGREAEGLFHMPGGQSGHPLSPFYRAGHAAWERGDPTPLLPGPAAHTLTLTP
jgi:penicillin amidase